MTGRPNFLNVDEAKERFGDLSTTGPVSAYYVFREPNGETWQPVYDGYLNLIGYRLEHPKAIRKHRERAR